MHTRDPLMLLARRTTRTWKASLHKKHIDSDSKHDNNARKWRRRRRQRKYNCSKVNHCILNLCDYTYLGNWEIVTTKSFFGASSTCLSLHSKPWDTVGLLTEWRWLCIDEMRDFCDRACEQARCIVSAQRSNLATLTHVRMTMRQTEQGTKSCFKKSTPARPQAFYPGRKIKHL